MLKSSVVRSVLKRIAAREIPEVPQATTCSWTSVASIATKNVVTVSSDLSAKTIATSRPFASTARHQRMLPLVKVVMINVIKLKSRLLYCDFFVIHNCFYTRLMFFCKMEK